MEMLPGIRTFGEKNNIPIVKFKSFEDLDWLECGFSTRFGGVSKGFFSSMNMSFCRGDDAADVMENIKLFSAAAGFKLENIVMPHQCHTTNVQIVGENELGRGVIKPGTEEEIDGQITNEPGTVLYVMGADCVPVFIADTENRVVSAVHAGWKGTVGNIISSSIEKMKSQFNCDTKNMKTVIGPSICGDCYEVSADVADIFIKKYLQNPDNEKAAGKEDLAGKTIHTNKTIVRPASGSFSDNPTGKYYLNLWEANRQNLIKAGIDPKNIEISGLCTRCHPDIFFSHRAHGNDRGVNIGYIFVK